MAHSPDVVEVQIWFVYTRQRKEISKARGSGHFQIHGKSTVVTLAGVPRSQLINGLPSAAVLWQAENTFLARQEDFYPDQEIIAWEARYNAVDGPLLSTFRVVVPAT